MLSTGWLRAKGEGVGRGVLGEGDPLCDWKLFRDPRRTRIRLGVQAQFKLQLGQGPEADGARAQN